MLQWHHTAVEPAGEARSDLWFMYHLGRRIRQKLAAAAGDTVLGQAAETDMDRPVLDLTWDYSVWGPQEEPDADAVLAEINGWDAEASRSPPIPSSHRTVRPGRAGGRPAAAHYEPEESPLPNLFYGQQHNPVRQIIAHPEDLLQPSGDEPGSDAFPYVVTTYRLTEHHTAGGMSRFRPYLAELQPAFFCEVSPELAAERGLEHLGWATIVSAPPPSRPGCW
jgi:anaerobic selenocysteine-containing dehydrogenase